MFPTTVLWFLFAALFGMVPSKTAQEVAGDAGAVCNLGSLVAQDGWTYEFRRADVALFAKVLYCESGRGIPGPEGEAIAWTLVHRFYQTHKLWGSFAGFLDAYSQCAGTKWSSAGHRRSKRDIVAQVDMVRSWSWEQIPVAGRWMAERFLAGLVPDAHPTWVHFLTCGYEQDRAEGTIGPYRVGLKNGACNVYYAMRQTEKWTVSTIVLVPAVSDLPPMLRALDRLWRSEQLGPWVVRISPATE